MRKQGVTITPDTLKIAENATLILPLHRELDQLREAGAGVQKIGTTGRGIGPAYEDKVGRRAIRVQDLRNLENLGPKIDRLLVHHNALRKGLGQPLIDKDVLIGELTAIAPKIVPHIDSAWSLLDAARKAGKRILFEGAQGALLDIDHGTYPYVTSSNTVGAQAAAGSGMGPKSLGTMLGLAKAYTTRVGSGPFPTELLDAQRQSRRRSANCSASAARSSAPIRAARAAAAGSTPCSCGRSAGFPASTASP